MFSVQKSVVLRFLFIALLALAACAGEQHSTQSDLRISLTQRTDGVELRYAFAEPVVHLLFETTEHDYRASHWQLPDGFMVTKADGFDILARNDRAAFSDVTISVVTDSVQFEKNYPALTTYGRRGLMAYTGHFHPVGKDGKRLEARFTFQAEEANNAFAFGKKARSLNNWQSPLRHPAFIYMGPLDVLETKHATMLVDPETPNWLQDQFRILSPATFAAITEMFGFTPSVKPSLFLSFELGDDPGRLSYAGDALPGQFHIKLRGGAWRVENVGERDLFHRSTVHEIVHLWQWDGLRHEGDDGDDWIHEGAADAIAAEVMLKLNLWDTDRYYAFQREASHECALALEDGALNKAHLRGDYRAFYACGHVIAQAIAARENKPTYAFWRDFMNEARQTGVFSANDFLAFVERRTDAPFRRAVRRFVETPFAQPEKEIEKLLEAARS